MTYEVLFAPEAEEDLVELFRYIAGEASPDIARRYTDAIVAHCEGFREFPLRAVRRDDIRPGLHITHYKSRAIIAFAVDGQQVSILGVFYGGRDYESALRMVSDE